MSFNEVGIDIEFKGEGINEKGYVKKCKNPEFQIKTGSQISEIDPKYFRPTEVDMLIGDATKAKEKLVKAIDILKECGADGWVEKYEKELASI